MHNNSTNGKGAHRLGQTNTPGGGYISFFCYTKWANVGGRSDLLVTSCGLLENYTVYPVKFTGIKNSVFLCGY